MIQIAFPALVAILGLVTYALGSGKVAELGRLGFLCGLLVVCYVAAGEHFHF